MNKVFSSFLAKILPQFDSFYIIKGAAKFWKNYQIYQKLDKKMQKTCLNPIISPYRCSKTWNPGFGCPIRHYALYFRKLCSSIMQWTTLKNNRCEKMESFRTWFTSKMLLHGTFLFMGNSVSHTLLLESFSTFVMLWCIWTLISKYFGY